MKPYTKDWRFRARDLAEHYRACRFVAESTEPTDIANAATADAAKALLDFTYNHGITPGCRVFTGRNVMPPHQDITGVVVEIGVGRCRVSFDSYGHDMVGFAREAWFDPATLKRLS